MAREIDPKSLIINANVGFVYYLAWDFDRAEEAEKTTLQLDPSFVSAHSYLGQIYVEKKRYEDAIHEFQTAASLAPGDIAGQADLAHGYAAAGRKSDADEVLREMQDQQGKQFVSGYDFATAYSGFKDVKKTLEWLEKAYVERNGRLANLAVHPQYAFLRGEARYRKLVEEIWGAKLIQAIK